MRTGPRIYLFTTAQLLEGYRTLKTGQIVNYEVKQGEKGLHAENVIPIGQKRRHRKHF